ncbi:MAG: oxidoreductase [Chloroflexi bacterium]|nr:oxidoreductase [Chloroflexota bacterium]
MPEIVCAVRSHTYVDSVTLLQVTADVLGLPGVENAALVMATDLNREVLHDAELLAGDALTAGPNDLVISVRATDQAAARVAVEQAEGLLTRRRTASNTNAVALPRSIRSAHRVDPEANLAVISVPGPYAAAEARLALSDGLNVFLFSDNVAIADEVQLKRAARERDLLVMGPDCGTASINGVGLGFANVVRRGSIGIVGASGTGIQEVACLLHRAGYGISHAIGTGSRDLHAAVGGITTLQAIELLRLDSSTETIVLVSKPSDPAVAERVLRALAQTGKPAVAHLQGAHIAMPEAVRAARTLAEAAAFATGAEPTAAQAHTGTSQGRVVGLFCGGTLAEEARAVLGHGHEVTDFGDDQYTRGRAHPMIDPSLRNEAILRAARDPLVGVLLLDFILGLGAHADPVGAALPALRAAIARGHLTVVAHVVGTDGDPQDLSHQESQLLSVGAHVCGSNVAAAQTASRLTAGVAA